MSEMQRGPTSSSLDSESSPRFSPFRFDDSSASGSSFDEDIEAKDSNSDVAYSTSESSCPSNYEDAMERRSDTGSAISTLSNPSPAFLADVARLKQAIEVGKERCRKGEEDVRIEGRYLEAVYLHWTRTKSGHWHTGFREEGGDGLGVVTLYGDPLPPHETIARNLESSVWDLLKDSIASSIGPSGDADFDGVSPDQRLQEIAAKQGSSLRRWKLGTSGNRPGRRPPGDRSLAKEADGYVTLQQEYLAKPECGVGFEVAFRNESTAELLREVRDGASGHGGRAAVMIGIRIDDKGAKRLDPALVVFVKDSTALHGSELIKAIPFGSGSFIHPTPKVKPLRLMKPTTNPGPVPSTMPDKVLRPYRHLSGIEWSNDSKIEINVGAALFESFNDKTELGQSWSPGYLDKLLNLKWTLDLQDVRLAILRACDSFALSADNAPPGTSN